MDQKKETNKEENSPPTFIFAVMVVTNILVNLDHGILPACTIQIQQELGMDEFELGLFGSIVYVGISVMGLFAGRMYQHFNSKNLTIIALIMLEVSLTLFVLSEHKITAYLSRFFTGGCQVFLIVYYPVWADKYGGDKKTMWITILQICIPVGMFTGYSLAAIVIATGHQYRLCFYIQMVIVAILTVTFLFFPKRTLDSRRNIDDTDSDPNKEEPISVQSVNQISENSRKYTVCYMLCHLMRSKMYLVGAFGIAIAFYSSTGAQFWLTKYFIDVLGFDEKSVLIAFAFVSVTGPTLGVIFGGYVISKNGGYDNPYAIYYVFIFSIITVLAGFVIPFAEGFAVNCIMLWIVFFFGGAMFPGLAGITMSSVSPYLRPFGNSTSEFIKNVFGNIPSPFVYGMLNKYFGKRAGLEGLVIWSMWAPILCGYGCWHKYNQEKKKRMKENSVFQELEVYSDQQESQNNGDQIQEHPNDKIKEKTQIKSDPEVSNTRCP